MRIDSKKMKKMILAGYRSDPSQQYIQKSTKTNTICLDLLLTLHNFFCVCFGDQPKTPQINMIFMCMNLMIKNVLNSILKELPLV